MPNSDPTTVCRTDRLYHYLLGGEEAIPAILEHGLLPLSARPASDHWRLIERERPGFFRDLYALFAEPVLRRPYRHSGVFLTPIDFRLMPDFPIAGMAEMTRIALPLTAIEARHAALTYELDGRRVTLPLTSETLAETARLWPAGRVRAWFGRNQSRLFFYVPQVAIYQDAAIPVRPAWLDPSPSNE